MTAGLQRHIFCFLGSQMSQIYISKDYGTYIFAWKFYNKCFGSEAPGLINLKIIAFNLHCNVYKQMQDTTLQSMMSFQRQMHSLSDFLSCRLGLSRFILIHGKWSLTGNVSPFTRKGQNLCWLSLAFIPDVLVVKYKKNGYLFLSKWKKTFEKFNGYMQRNNTMKELKIPARTLILHGKTTAATISCSFYYTSTPIFNKYIWACIHCFHFLPYSPPRIFPWGILQSCYYITKNNNKK